MKREENKSPKKMTRKDALKKMSFGAFTAATMLTLMNNPAKAQPGSPELPPDWY